MTQGTSQAETHENGPAPDWEALARHVTGESSPAESARIDAWLSGHPDERQILATLDTAMSRLADDVPGDLDIEGALRRVKERRDTPSFQVHRGGAVQDHPVPAPRWRVAFPAIAAAGLLVIGAGSWLAIRDEAGVPQAIEAQPRLLATGVGVRDSLTLPDGSRVVLGPMSSVTVSSSYGTSAREVEVRGDAWFDVVHDEARPFTVRAGNATIVDIGTKFAIRSDASDGVSVSVTEGSVSLRAVGAAEPAAVILAAGDHGVLQKSGNVIASRGIVTSDDVAWMSGRLVFREAPIADLVASVNRWYGIQLRFADSSLAGRRITTTFNGESPEKMLEVLGLILGSEIDRQGNTAVVRPVAGRGQSR